MAQLYEFIVSSGQVFSGLTAGNGQPKATTYVLPGGEIIDTAVFSSGWDVLSANTVAIGTTVMSGGIEFVLPNPFLFQRCRESWLKRIASPARHTIRSS